MKSDPRMSGSLVAALIVFERKRGAPPGTAQELIAWWRRRVSEPLEVVDVSFLCPCCCDGVAGFSYPWEVREEIERIAYKLPSRSRRELRRIVAADDRLMLQRRDFDSRDDDHWWMAPDVWN